jgi:DMSO/TMAO reductase YedYZ molybdopterin-dependent catalytic subunit
VDLTSRQLIERPVTVTCVSNAVGGPYISTANVTGVLLADILEEAGVRRGADQVFTTSVDGWTCGSPTAVLTDPGRQALLVIGMNGEPLPIEHGFPVRMIVPGLSVSCPPPSGSPIWSSPRSTRSGLIGSAAGAASPDQDNVPD